MPASLRLVWAEELEKWLPHLRPSCIHVIEGKADRVAQARAQRACFAAAQRALGGGLGGHALLRAQWAQGPGVHRCPACLPVGLPGPPLCSRASLCLQGALPHVVITSYEMMQRLTCDACKGRGGPHTSVCSGSRPPCRDTQNCMAAQRWRVVIVDGEGQGLFLRGWRLGCLEVGWQAVRPATGV